MKKSFTMIMLAVIAFASCTKNTLPEVVNNSKTSFSATIQDDGTKTSLDGLNVYWSAGDQIDVIYDKASFPTSHETCTLVGGGGTKNGTFQGTVDLSGRDLFVVYPPADGYSSAVQTIEIPNEYTYGSASTVIPMYGTGTVSEGVTFHHSCSVVKIPVYTDPGSNLSINKATLTNTLSDKITGRFYYRHTSSAYNTSLTPNTTGNYLSSTLNCNGLSVSEDSANPTVLYFIVRGGINFTPRLDVTFMSSLGSYSKSKATSITLQAGKSLAFPLTKISATNDLQMNIDNQGWEDYVLDSLSNATTSVKIRSTYTILDATSVTNIFDKIQYLENPIILDMSQARYYAANGKLPNLLATRSRKITKFYLPNGVTLFPNGAITDDSGVLTDIYLPSTVSTIGNGAINPEGEIISSTLSVHVDSLNTNFSEIDGVIFNNSQTQLVLYPMSRTAEEYSVPSGVTSILGSSFCYARFIKRINIPSTVTTINASCFMYNSKLEKITFAGATPPTLSGNLTSGRLPGSSVTGTKQLAIPSSSCVDAYNAAGWDKFTAVGYSYYY